jgi:hypothetical protein
MIDEVERVVNALRVVCSEYECDECPSYAWCHSNGQCLDWDAADLIESLAAKLEQVKQERDAAVKDMQKSALYLCQVCKKYHPAVKGVHAHFCEQLGQRTDFNGAIACGMFEWRGVQEVDNAEND